ncbi:hypothetical protein RFI_02331 [Reticulomyxa filosa]|uniref:Uncharacterized protein n=1 Tax=Reticulomyxa filosa TaxID=46433 RepID=X6P9K9_RETFI|nr:hypothetical protein RFI_02331 [Reticulomyxa filosa]|eukprot:ETO34754.1 hypothetical protein RFI_02331 [Reticulomyxa filosa]
MIYIQHNISGRDERYVILSDYKFTVNAIHNKYNSDTYNFPLSDYQRLIKEVDVVAKRDILQAKFDQTELFRRPDRTAQFLNFQGLNTFFTEEWNRHWTNEYNEMESHKHTKQYLRNLIESQSFEKIILHRFDVHERRYFCRIINGKIGLHYFLYKIKIA